MLVCADQLLREDNTLSHYRATLGLLCKVFGVGGEDQMGTGLISGRCDEALTKAKPCNPVQINA